jgi:hypothetical protein
MKLRDWIEIDKLYWEMLSRNPNAIDILKENKDKINWYFFISKFIYFHL